VHIEKFKQLQLIIEQAQNIERIDDDGEQKNNVNVAAVVTIKKKELLELN
jgi:hypothetical protein